MTSFVDSIAQCIRTANTGAGQTAEEIVAATEMQSIREALYQAYVRPYLETLNQTAALNTARSRMAEAGLAPCVMEWVLP